MIDKFPYGKAPFWLFAVALGSTLLLAFTRGERPERPDLVLAIFAEQHIPAYKRAIPHFERTRNVRVTTQLVNWQSLQTRVQNALLADTEVPDMLEIAEGSLGFFTRGPREDIGFLDLTDRIHGEGYYDRMVASRFSLWTARGRIYALPHDVHPVALAYRRDIVEALGIDVKSLDTWEAFVEVGRRVTGDRDGDGVLDQYMLDLPYDGSWGLLILIVQRGGQLFDAEGRVAFNSEVTEDTIVWYLEQTHGPRKIAYECGWGQPLLKAMTDGLALFYWTPDWRSYLYQKDVPGLKGKMGIMPLPAWEKGGRRTSVWGGTGLTITKRTKRPDLAWDLAKTLYFDQKELGQRFTQTNIIPPLRDAWNLPEFATPNAYYSGQKIGLLYAELAAESPPFYSAPLDAAARAKLNEAFGRALEYYEDNGTRGLREKVRRELATAEAYVNRLASRQARLVEGKD